MTVEPQQRFQQYRGARPALLIAGELCSGMTQAALAGHKNHAHRPTAADLLRIVAGAAGEVAMGQAKIGGGLSDRGHTTASAGVGSTLNWGSTAIAQPVSAPMRSTCCINSSTN